MQLGIGPHMAPWHLMTWMLDILNIGIGRVSLIILTHESLDVGFEHQQVECLIIATKLLFKIPWCSEPSARLQCWFRTYPSVKFDYCYNDVMLRTQCKAVPRRVPRQDCQQVPTLQVRKPSFEIPGYQNLKTDLQCTNVGKEQCQTIPRQACKSVPKYEFFSPFFLISAQPSIQVCPQVSKVFHSSWLCFQPKVGKPVLKYENLCLPFILRTCAETSMLVCNQVWKPFPILPYYHAIPCYHSHNTFYWDGPKEALKVWKCPI